MFSWLGFDWGLYVGLNDIISVTSRICSRRYRSESQTSCFANKAYNHYTIAFPAKYCRCPFINIRLWYLNLITKHCYLWILYILPFSFITNSVTVCGLGISESVLQYLIWSRTYDEGSNLESWVWSILLKSDLPSSSKMIIVLTNPVFFLVTLYETNLIRVYSYAGRMPLFEVQRYCRLSEVTPVSHSSPKSTRRNASV